MGTYSARVRITIADGTDVEVKHLLNNLPGVRSEMLSIRPCVDPDYPATSKRNFTRSLHAAEHHGKVVVASVGPHGMEGCPVEYAPRSRPDPKPWRSKNPVFACYRLSGRDCHAVDARIILSA